MAQVVLVRHAMPETQPDAPAERWRLGDNGRAAARELADALPRAPFALTSDEPKAQQTAAEIVAICGGTLAVDARVAETRRPHVWDASFRELARQYVAGHQHPGGSRTMPSSVASMQRSGRDSARVTARRWSWSATARR
jgi:broad specificity phosphatase PhoE